MEYIGRAEHEEYAKRMEEEHSRQNKSINNVEEMLKRYTEMAISVEKLAIGVENMVEEQKKQGARLEKLEEVPAKNWTSLKVGFYSAIGGACFLLEVCARY